MAIHQQTIDYFQAHQNYFWRWAEGGNVIEFANERTVCYREDLSNILTALPQTTSLSLGTVLLILCACKDNWEELYNAEAIINAINPSSLGEEQNESDHFVQLKAKACVFLGMLNKLPIVYRSAANRTALLQCIFDALAVKGYHMGLLPLLKEFNSGEMDEQIFGKTQPLAQTTIVQDFAPLAAALEVFGDTDSLEMKLRTGLTNAPTPISLPSVTPGNESLIEQLENDDSTISIAGLAKRIMAALYIPLHLDGRDDQNLGGVSDIATKGTYDKLLLSELAYDDDLLSVRLANNEALFFQREAVPENKNKELGLIIDSTLKMWGAARVYAVATAVAFAESKHEHQKLKVWSLGGKHADIYQLEGKKDVVALLEKMDISMHCGEMLLKTVKEIDKNGQYILVTSTHFLRDPASAPYLLQVREHLDYLVTISSSGELQMTQLNKKRSKLVHEAKIDLDRILLSRRKVNSKIVQENLPAVLYDEQFPLYFPTSKIRHKQNELYRMKNNGVVTVSIDHRFLYWPSKNFGAVELVSNVPAGKYCFGELDQLIVLVVIAEANEVVSIFSIDPKTKIQYVNDVAVASRNATDLKYVDGYFRFNSDQKTIVIDVRSAKIITEEQANQLNLKSSHTPSGGMSQLKKHLNNGYSVINSSKAIFVHAEDNIFSDKKEFALMDNEFRWHENEMAAAQWVKPSSQEIFYVDHLPNIKFTKFTWKNGSTAVVDSRGLLHLKSYKQELPEIGIIMIIDQPTACWSMDGYVSGSRYFIGEPSNHLMPPAQFYEKYIQRFIDNLK